MTQSINLHSIRNARELGGYILPDGRMIKRGLLLRTGKLCDISDEDADLLKNRFHLGDIVDFRMEMELPGAEDPSIDGARYRHLDVIVPTPDFTRQAAGVDLSALDNIQMAELSVQIGLPDEYMYVDFLSADAGMKAYSAFFRVLLEAEPDRAVLWHCTSGKDRTGLAAMLLLAALGADEGLIIDDYLLTNKYNADRIARTRAILSGKGRPEDYIRRAVLIMDGVDGRFMTNATEYLKKEYGSVTGYITDALGISSEDIDILKAKYLI